MTIHEREKRKENKKKKRKNKNTFKKSDVVNAIIRENTFFGTPI